MAKMVPILLAEEVLTIADDTPATLNVLFKEVPNEGLVWLKLQTVTATAGLALIDVKWQPMGFKKGINSTEASDLSTSGSAVTIATGENFQSVGDFQQYSLPVNAALQGSVKNAIHFDGLQISLTGDTDDDGTIWASVWTWSY